MALGRGPWLRAPAGQSQLAKTAMGEGGCAEPAAGTDGEKCCGANGGQAGCAEFAGDLGGGQVAGGAEIAGDERRDARKTHTAIEQGPARLRLEQILKGCTVPAHCFI